MWTAALKEEGANGQRSLSTAFGGGEGTFAVGCRHTFLASGEQGPGERDAAVSTPRPPTHHLPSRRRSPFVGTLTPPHGSAPHEPRDPRRQPPLPRRRGRRLRREVGDRLRRGRAAQVSGSSRSCSARGPGRTRARSRSARAPATSRSTCCGPASSATPPAPTLAGHARDARGQRAAARLDVETAACDAAELPFEDGLRPRARPRGAAPCPRWSAPSPSSRASCAPAARCSSPASPRARATASRPGRSARPCAPRRSGARRSACGRPTPATANGGPPRPEDAEHALESLVDVHAFDPADLERLMAGAGLSTPGSRARSCSRTGSAGSTARSRRARATTTSRGCGSSTRSAATSALQRVDRALLEPRLPPGLLQPDDRGPQAEAVAIDVARARAETPGVEHVAHLNNAGAALPPEPVLDAVSSTCGARRDRRLRGGGRAARAHRAQLRRDRAR